MADEANKAASSDFVRALRSAAFTGLIAFGLFLPLIAFKAVHDIRNELVLETRWELFAIFVAIAFGARLIWELLPHARIKVGMAHLHSLAAPARDHRRCEFRHRRCDAAYPEVGARRGTRPLPDPAPDLRRPDRDCGGDRMRGGMGQNPLSRHDR